MNKNSDAKNAKGRVIIISAPSGTGKSTIISYLMTQGLNLHFSVSATSRPPRGKEVNGVDYFFLTPEEFRLHISKGDFLEYQEVYQNRYYGTLRTEVDKQLAKGENVVCDIDVIGAQNIKKIYGNRAFSLFIKPPSIDALRQRLENRGTDSQEVIQQRIERAEFELAQASHFDACIVNDALQQAQEEAADVIRQYLQTTAEQNSSIDEDTCA